MKKMMKKIREFVNRRDEKYKVLNSINIPVDAYYFKDPEGKPVVLKDTNERERYPFSMMKVEDSFFIGGLSARDMRGAIFGASKRYNHKYISRTVVGGARVWRHI